MVNLPKKSKSSHGHSLSFEEILSLIQKRAQKKNSIGHTLKFNFGDKQLFIDGKSANNTVRQTDEQADCTINIGLKDFEALIKGKLDPMQAMMSGKLKIEGDMAVAMKLQSIFS